jgi:hypothetical protein
MMNSSFSKFGRSGTFGCAALAVLITTSLLATEAEEIDHPREVIELPATTLVDPELFASTAYQLDPTVTLYRGRAFFELHGPKGSEVVVSRRQLLARLDELNALAALEAMKKSDVYVESLKKAGAAPINFGKSLVTKPVDTVGRVGRGIGGFFADVGYSITGDDPDQENVAKTALGFGAAKRNFAFELGVNPYSDFQPLQEALGEVAWTAVGGNFTVSIGFRAIGGSPGKVLSLSKTANGMRKLVRDKSPRELKNINAEKLKAMGVNESLSEALLGNENYDPETETRLIGALESMATTKARERFVKRAALVTSPADARMLRDWAELMAAYHDVVEPIVEIVVVDSAPQAVLSNAVAQTIYPADFVSVSPGFQSRLQSLADGLRGKGLTLGGVWVSGGAASGVEDMMLGIGWTEFRDGVVKDLFAE